MIKTPFTQLFGIEHPIALGGLGAGHTQPDMVAAVSEAGGFGAMGCAGLAPDEVRSAAAAIRAKTDKPFALNFLMFMVDDEAYQAALDEQPAAIALAWNRSDQDLKPFIDRAHEVGAKVTYMVSGVGDAVRGVEAGADVIIAQGTEGGGHIGWMGSVALTPMVVDAVAPVPVLAAGGFADGRGLAAALALGAGGILMGTRFLATEESPLHPNFKQAIIDSDGHDTEISNITDVAAGIVWPGAMARAKRNALVERWSGREWDLRRHQKAVAEGIQKARQAGDIDEAPLSYGQDAGLINDLPATGELIRRIVADAEAIIGTNLPSQTQ